MIILMMLHFSHMTLSHVSVRAIAQLNVNDPTIHQLDLSPFEFSLKEFTSICEALKFNNSLHQLTLSNNVIHQNGTSMLYNALKINTSLRKLDLYNHSIYGNSKEKGEKELQHFIKVNCHPDQFEADMDEKKQARVQFLQMKWRLDPSIHSQFPKQFQKEVSEAVILYLY